MSTPLITIIIPIYNTRKWLVQCTDSCLNQSLKEIEIILVNDASPDDSLSICKAYQEKDKRINVINKLYNEGVEKARWSGLQIARGKYVMLVDSDDWLENKDVLFIMYEKAEETESDYAEIGIQRVLDKRKWIKKTCISPVIGLIEQPNLFKDYYLSFFGVNILPVNMCGKLYRKSVLNKVDLSPIGVTMGEDLAFNLLLFPHLKRICILNIIGYNYRFSGMTTRYNPYLLPDLKRLYQLKKELIAKYQYNKASDFIRIELKNVLKSAIYQIILFRKGNRKEIINRIHEEIKDEIYNDITEINEHPHFFNDTFVKALLDKDAEKMYDICSRQVRTERFQYILKRIIAYLLQF